MQANIAAMIQNPSSQIRAELAGYAVQSLQNPNLKLTEIDAAVDVLRILARDLEVQVRRSLALSLCHSTIAPHDVILRLANDVSDVALPVLQFSGVLTDEDLEQLIENAEEVMKLVAIARRDKLSDGVAGKLIQSGEERVIYTLFRNNQANISDRTIDQNWSTISSSQNLLETLVQRGGLSVAIAEKLYTIVSSEMKRYLASTYQLPDILVEDSIDRFREEKTLNLTSPNLNTQEKEVDALVHQLYTSNRLSYSIVIRALCNGDLAFFEAAMSRLAGVPKKNAHILIYDSGSLGFKAFYEKAKLPSAFYDAIHTILRMGIEIKSSGGMPAAEFRNTLITQIQAKGLDYTIENMHYLLSLVMQTVPDSNRNLVH
jgi:uncharacterized protein (DUF2336 family)